MQNNKLLRFRPVLLAAGLWLAISTATRLALALRPDLGPVGGAGEWLRVFGYGLAFDLVTALYILAPAVLWLALLPQRLAASAVHRAAAFLAFCVFASGFLVLAVSEWLFWDEFGGRFNFIAVDYLLYTHEVVVNVWQSYPIGKLVLALAALAVVAGMLLRRPLWDAAGAPLAWRTALVVLAAWSLAIAGSLRWIDTDVKSFSRRDAANDLAGNGLYEFFAANYRNELSYDRHYATLPSGEDLKLVRAALGVPEGEGVERHVVPGRPERRLNVVLVSVESLGAEFLGAYDNARGLTPNLDRLARESLWFSSVYATGNRTVRGLEALALALPPSPGQSIVRRPGNDMLFSLGSVFEDKGYSVLFAYGGYGYFDNMNAFFDANDYRVVDRRGIPAERIKFENVWGVADEYLFEQVIDEIDRDHAGGARPFFVHVMTTSNHRPYTYPAGRIDIPSGWGREGAVKYTDYAIGRFLEQARRRPWFDDTLFVITADHGANARGTMRIPVDKYLIPLFIYSPKHVAPARVGRLMSQIDIAPTVLGLLDFDYYSKFFGRDVLASPPQSDRAFVANYQALGYLRGDRLALLYPKRKTEVFRVDARWNPVEAVDDPGMLREAIAFYSAASYVFRRGLYRDEEQTPPEQRAALTRVRDSRD
jgi:phosphoglycerol transferase MdoB-like AlkP superfamily enzyme